MTYLDLPRFPGLPHYRIRANKYAWVVNTVTISQSGASKGQELETFVGNYCTKEGLCKALPERIAREALASGEFAMMDVLNETLLKLCVELDKQRIKGRAA